MRRFRNILLAVEGDGQADGVLDRAAALACRNEARLTIARVLPALPRELRRLSLPIDPDCLLELATEEHLGRLRRLVAPWAERLCIGTKVLWGTGFLEIIREVIRQRHDLVIVSAAEKHSIGTVFFGATSLHLMRKCPCPVWVLNPASGSRAFRSVLAAVDALAYDEEHRGLNEEIMELAVSVARRESAQLHVVHAWKPWTATSIPAEIGYTRQFLDDVADQCEEQHERALTELIEATETAGLVVHKHLIYGHAGEAIAEAASQHSADVIVMGTVCRTGVQGLFIGNIAEAVLQRVRCSVLTLKPAGFVTPVTLRDMMESAASV